MQCSTVTGELADEGNSTVTSADPLMFTDFSIWMNDKFHSSTDCESIRITND